MKTKNQESTKDNKTSKSQGNAKSMEYEVPPEGSLGLLALGYRGLVAWREARKKKS